MLFVYDLCTLPGLKPHGFTHRQVPYLRAASWSFSLMILAKAVKLRPD
jgi:hypothetical protein